MRACVRDAHTRVCAPVVSAGWMLITRSEGVLSGPIQSTGRYENTRKTGAKVYAWGGEGAGVAVWACVLLIARRINRLFRLTRFARAERADYKAYRRNRAPLFGFCVHVCACVCSRFVATGYACM